MRSRPLIRRRHANSQRRPCVGIPTVTSAMLGRKGLLRTCWIPATLLCLLSAGRSGAQEQDLLKNLMAMWKSQKSEIHSAHIKCRSVTLGGDKFSQLKADALGEVFRTADLPKHPDDLNGLLDKLLVSADARAPWERCEYFIEGNRLKEIDSRPNVGTTVFDGKDYIEYSPGNKYAGAFVPGQFKRYVPSLNDFRRIPDSAEAAGSVARRMPDGRVSVTQGTAEAIFDEATGILLKLVGRGRQGNVEKVVLQQDLVTYPEGICFPSLVVEAAFGPGQTLRRITIRLVDEASFNIALPADTFNVAVPEKTGVIDFRDSKRTRSTVAGEPEANVRDYLDRVPGVVARPKASHLWARLSIAVVVGLALAVIWRGFRRRAGRQPG